MTIRKATFKDLYDIMDLESEAWPDPDICSDQRQWQTYLTDEIVFCALIDEGLIGGVLLATREFNGNLTIEKLFVHPDYQHEGLGTELINQFIAIQNQACARAFLYVADVNLIAQKFFQLFCFTECPAEAALYRYTHMIREPDSAHTPT